MPKPGTHPYFVQLYRDGRVRSVVRRRKPHRYELHQTYEDEEGPWAVFAVYGTDDDDAVAAADARRRARVESGAWPESSRQAAET